MISFDDFAKVELRVGTVLEAEEVKGSEKLIKLNVSKMVPAGTKIR